MNNEIKHERMPAYEAYIDERMIEERNRAKYNNCNRRIRELKKEKESKLYKIQCLENQQSYNISSTIESILYDKLEMQRQINIINNEIINQQNLKLKYKVPRKKSQNLY